MPYTQTQTRTQLFTGTSAADDALAITAENVRQFNKFVVLTSAGEVDIEVSLDGATYGATVIALEDLTATAPATRVVNTTAGKPAAFYGKFTSVRLRQKGATGVTAFLLCGQ